MKRHSRPAACVLGLVAFATGTGCRDSAAPVGSAGAPKSAAPAAADPGRSGSGRAVAAPGGGPVRPGAADGVQTYKLAGVVRHVNPSSGIVTIRHEAIPGFMDTMTMPFTLKDRALLDDVHVGDEVEGSLRVVREGGEVKDYELTDLNVSRPAPGPGFTLNLKGGTPQVTATPGPLAPGDEVPDFTMTDAQGKPLRLSDLRGRVVALTFIYTRCPLPDFCPRLDAKFAEASGRVPAGKADRVRFLSVSFDPEHDTPEVLGRHARARGARPPLWTFAVASHEQLARVARPLGLVYGPGRDEVAHNLVVAVIGPDGRLARLEAGAAARGWSADDLLRAMYSLIPASTGPK